jgi:hypothetical protein
VSTLILHFQNTAAFQPKSVAGHSSQTPKRRGVLAKQAGSKCCLALIEKLRANKIMKN